MKRLTGVNWSAVVRDAIEERVRIEELSDQRDWDRVRRAAKDTDSIYEQIKRKYGHIEYNSADTIRFLRNAATSQPYSASRRG